VLNDPFIGLKTFVDQGLSLFDLGDFDGAHLDGLVVLDHEGVGAVGSALDDGGRDDKAVVAGGQQQAGVHELAGPETKIVIGKVRLQADGAGRRVDLVVDDSQCSFPEDSAVVTVHGQDGDIVG